MPKCRNKKEKENLETAQRKETKQKEIKKNTRTIYLLLLKDVTVPLFHPFAKKNSGENVKEEKEKHFQSDRVEIAYGLTVQYPIIKREPVLSRRKRKASLRSEILTTAVFGSAFSTAMDPAKIQHSPS